MTAAGLAVAIPAVLAYNIFGKLVGACEAELEGFAHDLREMIDGLGIGRPDMAFGRLERTVGPQPMSDINMTPLIDVMLVLLVIFMITAPLMTSALKLDLPKAEGAQPSDAPQSIALSLDAQGQMFVGDEEVDEATLRERVGAGRAPEPADRGAAARRPQRALRPRGRADRPGAEGRAEPHRLRHRTGRPAVDDQRSAASCAAGSEASAQCAETGGCTMNWFGSSPRASRCALTAGCS